MQTNQNSQSNYLEFLKSTPYLRIKPTCEFLQRSKTDIYRLVAADKLRLVKIGERASAITTESIANYLQSINVISK